MGSGKIVVLGTGGTIAGTGSGSQDHVGYTAAQLGIAELVEGVPGLEDVALQVEQVAQVDSKDMDEAIWRALAARCAEAFAASEVQGIVVTHGTDTLEETAYFLHRLLAPAKPLVLTCAMRPSTALMADGPQNLLDAMSVARTPGARGVLVVCAGQLHGAEAVAKRHAYRLDAFSSGESGPVAVVEEGRVRRVGGWPEAPAADPQWTARVLGTNPWPRVEIVTSHAGAGGGVVDALVAQGVDGIVVAGTGNGTVHRALLAALERARARGVRVLRASRCADGRVLPHSGDMLPGAGGLSPVKARIELQLALLSERWSAPSTDPA